MPSIKQLITAFFIACLLQFDATAAGIASINDISFNQENNLEISLQKDASNRNDFKVFMLQNPRRLVVDINNAAFNDRDKKIIFPNFISKIRYGQNQTYLRIVFDLNEEINIERSVFQTIKNQKNSKVIIYFSKTDSKKENIKEANLSTMSQAISEGFEVQTQKVINPDGSAKYIVKKIPKNIPTTVQLKPISRRLPIIVVDAGHGGKDPGTIGNYARTREKNITLSYAKELVKQLNNSKHYKAYLTRGDDYFIPLRTRVEKARRIKADLFISLHVNSISDRSVSGFSIYTLSEKSSDKQAELLAQKENRADIISGVNFSNASQDIMKTLIDLSQRETKNTSATFANLTIKSVKKSGIEILQNTHRFAGFAVLTAPDMASTLIELGYLSNKEEEKLLNSIIYKRKLTEALVDAINNFFSQNKT